MLYNLKEASVAVRGSQIDYAVFGKGTRPMVILPGLSLRDVKGAGFGLALMYRLFAKDYRVYVLDKKADIPEGCTVKDLADDTAVVMKALGIAHSADLGGIFGERVSHRDHAGRDNDDSGGRRIPVFPRRRAKCLYAIASAVVRFLG